MSLPPLNAGDEERLEWGIAQLRKLVKLGAPATIKAHCLIQVLLPKMMNIVGAAECLTELGSMATRGMAIHVGYCYMCRKHPVMGGEGNDCDICAKCSAEYDQLTAGMNLEEEP